MPFLSARTQTRAKRLTSFSVFTKMGVELATAIGQSGRAAIGSPRCVAIRPRGRWWGPPVLVASSREPSRAAGGGVPCAGVADAVSVAQTRCAMFDWGTE